MRHAQAALVSSHAPSALVAVVSPPPPRGNEQLCIASSFLFSLALVVRSRHSSSVRLVRLLPKSHWCV